MTPQFLTRKSATYRGFLVHFVAIILVSSIQGSTVEDPGSDFTRGIRDFGARVIPSDPLFLLSPPLLFSTRPLTLCARALEAMAKDSTAKVEMAKKARKAMSSSSGPPAASASGDLIPLQPRQNGWRTSQRSSFQRIGGGIRGRERSSRPHRRTSASSW